VSFYHLVMLFVCIRRRRTRKPTADVCNDVATVGRRGAFTLQDPSLHLNILVKAILQLQRPTNAATSRILTQADYETNVQPFTHRRTIKIIAQLSNNYRNNLKIRTESTHSNRIRSEVFNKPKRIRTEIKTDYSYHQCDRVHDSS